MIYLRILKDKSKTKGKGYLIYCGPEADDTEEDSAANEWNGRIMLIKKALKQNESRIQEVLKVNERSGEKMHIKMEEKIANLEGKLETKMKEQGEQMKEQNDQMKKQVDQMKEQIETMKKELTDRLSEMLKELKPAPKEAALLDQTKKISPLDQTKGDVPATL